MLSVLSTAEMGPSTSPSLWIPAGIWPNTQTEQQVLPGVRIQYLETMQTISYSTCSVQPAAKCWVYWTKCWVYWTQYRWLSVPPSLPIQKHTISWCWSDILQQHILPGVRTQYMEAWEYCQQRTTIHAVCVWCTTQSDTAGMAPSALPPHFVFKVNELLSWLYQKKHLSQCVRMHTWRDRHTSNLL